jgi:dihydrofolate reductase
MQGPGGPDEDRDGGFEHGGWNVPFWDQGMGELMNEQMSRGEALLLGRKTYEIFAGYWPKVGDEEPAAAKLNRMPKYVASRTLDRVEWENSKLIPGDVAQFVAELKQKPGGEIQVTGSSNLIQTLLTHDLVDEFVIWTWPVVLGTGKRLFDGGTIPAGLELADNHTSTTGVTINTYRRAGAVQTGSFALDEG